MAIFPARNGSRSFDGHSTLITAVEFVLGGKLLLTADADGVVLGWKAPSFDRHCRIEHANPAPIYRFAEARGQSHVFYSCGAAVKQWALGAGFLDDWSEMKSLTLGEAHTGEVVPVLSTARELVSGGYDGNICFWDKGTGEVEIGSLGSPILSLACTSGALYYASAGGLLAAGLEDGTVAIIDLAKKERIGRVEAHVRDVYSVSFRNVISGRKALATCSPADAAVRVWEHGKLEVEFEAGAFALAFSPDGRFLAHGDGKDVVIRAAGNTWQIVRRLRGHADIVNALSFSPLESIDEPWTGWLASGSHAGTVRVWSAAEIEGAQNESVQYPVLGS
jgi:WD40 repeat protein